MVKDLWEIIRYSVKKVLTSRLLPVILLFCAMFALLVFRLFDLQILQGARYQEQHLENTRREIYTPATRGNIYDCNGVPLAYNELTYSVTVVDNGTYANGYEKNKMLLRLVRLLEKYDVNIISNVPLAVMRDGTIAFTTGSEARHRSFLRDFYGLRSAEQLDSYDKEGKLQNRSDITAQEVYEKYIRDYGIGKDGPRQEKDGYEYTLQEGLHLINMREAMAASYYQKWKAVTLATGLDTETMVAVKEASADMSGVDIAGETIRIYNDAHEFAHILGYTGKASTDDLENLEKEAEEAGVAEEKQYALNDVVGKAGIEQYMELELSGKKGAAQVYVDSEGRIVDTASSTEPTAGNDVYLSIDRNLQVGIYHLLEQQLAGILVSKIENVEPDDPKVTLKERTPVKMVYYQLIGNNILSMAGFYDEDASEVEREIYQKMLAERDMVMGEIRYELTREDPKSYNDMDENNQAYTSYIMRLLREGGYILSDQIDSSDEIFQAWGEGTISLKEYLYHAISMNWIDTTKLDIDEKYPAADTIYEVMLDTVMDILETNSDFCKKIYEILIYNGTITGKEVCLALFEQGVLEWNDEDVQALTPCAGSVILTDLKTGQIRALVSYPSYDINRLSGSVEAAYYSQLQNDAATPLYNTATQVLRAPGSVFKMITATAGLEEGLVTLDEIITDTGTYVQFDNAFRLNCWYTRGHGPLNVVGALSMSCNYYFCEVGYRLSLDENGNYSSALGLDKLGHYAALFGFDSKSGIEIYENEPHISDEMPIPSAIGQGTNAFANIHLARYLAAIATRGNMYRLTLLDRVTDSAGNLLNRHQPEIQYKIELKESTWNALWEGMKGVIAVGVPEPFRNSVVSLAGKTGTAQEVTTRPNHARFIGFAPVEDPQIGVTVTIPNGYTGTNAAYLANAVLDFYYGETSLESILSGDALQADGGARRD